MSTNTSPNEANAAAWAAGLSNEKLAREVRAIAQAAESGSPLLNGDDAVLREAARRIEVLG